MKPVWPPHTREGGSCVSLAKLQRNNGNSFHIISDPLCLAVQCIASTLWNRGEKETTPFWLQHYHARGVEIHTRTWSECVYI